MKEQVIGKHTKLKLCFLIMPGAVVRVGVNAGFKRYSSWDLVIAHENLRNHLTRWIQVCASFELLNREFKLPLVYRALPVREAVKNLKRS